MIASARSDEQIRRERHSFILLQHVCTVTDADPARGVSISRAALELGFEPGEMDAIVRHLIDAEYLVLARGGTALCITGAGADYVERLAGRRRSVRLRAEDQHDVLSAVPEVTP